MKKLRKRVFSLLLACVMAFSLLPATARAAAFDPNQPPDYVPEALKLNGYIFMGSYQIEDSDLLYAIYQKWVSEPTPGMDNVVIFAKDPSKTGSN